jgi:hypothetical protein
MSDLNRRIRRVQNCVERIALGTSCPACLDGKVPFLIHRWIRAGGVELEESEPSDVYDQGGQCRCCQCGCREPLILERPTGASTRG